MIANVTSYDAALYGDEHNDDDPACDCTGCAVLERQRRAREAATYGGLAQWAHEVLGPGWLEGKGASVEILSARDLAQRALGETFEQLERIARTGRERCHHSTYRTSERYSPSERIKRQDAVELLRLIDNSLDYARVHLDYLERPLELTVGDRVAIASDEPWSGELRGIGTDRAIVRDDDGVDHEVDVRDVRAA